MNVKKFVFSVVLAAALLSTGVFAQTTLSCGTQTLPSGTIVFCSCVNGPGTGCRIIIPPRQLTDLRARLALPITQDAQQTAAVNPTEPGPAEEAPFKQNAHLANTPAEWLPAYPFLK